MRVVEVLEFQTALPIGLADVEGGIVNAGAAGFEPELGGVDFEVGLEGWQMKVGVGDGAGAGELRIGDGTGGADLKGDGAGAGDVVNLGDGEEVLKGGVFGGNGGVDDFVVGEVEGGLD